MKIERSKEWWLEQTRREGISAVGAGPAMEEAAPERSEAVQDRRSSDEVSRIAFGRFINLKRRQLGLSLESLAEKADVELAELVCIEGDLQHSPEIRTIYQLSQTFGVSQTGLMRLAGYIEAKDNGFREEVVRYAARAEPVQKLSREESAALDALLSVLSRPLEKAKGIKD